jgi:hypothetical protein
MVSAIEALIVPYSAWGRSRSVARFIHGVEELCPEAVEELTQHPNVVDALGLRPRGGRNRRHRDLLERVYDLRSISIHGLWSGRLPLMGAIGASESVKPALLADLFVEAFLAFIQAPRSFLHGHPLIDITPQDQERPKAIRHQAKRRPRKGRRSRR